MEPFKDKINRHSIGQVADRFSKLAGFDEAGFRRAANRGLGLLELKDRVRHVAKALREYLDPEYETALRQITETLDEPLSGTDEVSTGLFIEWPLLQFIEDQASNQAVDLEEHFEVSIEALHALTQRFSAEFAIRPFLARAPDRTLEVLEHFARDPSPHVRRLASEGSRPRLPWGMRLNGLHTRSVQNAQDPRYPGRRRRALRSAVRSEPRQRPLERSPRCGSRALRAVVGEEASGPGAARTA